MVPRASMHGCLAIAACLAILAGRWATLPIACVVSRTRLVGGFGGRRLRPRMRAMMRKDGHVPRLRREMNFVLPRIVRDVGGDVYWRGYCACICRVVCWGNRARVDMS